MIVIDFFCGCGGASEGLRQAGFDIELGLDIDQQASETFKANFPDAKFIQDDIRKIEPQDISDIIDIAKWHLNRSQFGIRIDHDLASISDHSLASQSITIWHASDH